LKATAGGKRMRKIRLRVAYEGTRFAGWQTQKEDRTVQAVLEAALEKVCGRKTPLTGAGRTDSGVHATGQTAHFETDRDSIPADRFAVALNRNLPHDVRVLESREAPADFHARYRAVLRVYRYYVYNTAVGLPHLRHFAWRVHRPLDLERLNRLAARLVGRHDFTSFTAVGDPAESKVRTIVTSHFSRAGDFIVYHIAAPSFLWRMVRSIVGTIVECALEGRGEEEFSRILEARDRVQAGRTAPAHGLFLEEVHYDEGTGSDANGRPATGEAGDE
jgi:tRNA pseudouridine38-40 synthase